MNELELKHNEYEKEGTEEFSYDCFEKEETNERKKLNELLKTLRNENREACFSLLNYFYLNRKFEFQNLKESLEDGADANEFINLKILKKEIYPKDGNYEEKKEERNEMLNKILNMKPCLDKGSEKYKNMDSIGDSINRIKAEEKYLQKDENMLHEMIPHFWKKDDIVGVFNPVYNAREKLLNEEVMNAIPTIDIFYNSSKLMSIQTIFEPVSDYIFLLRLLPHFCLPLYDSGILQFVCEDAYLNPKFKGLEISYRLLIHDILFYAFFSYLSDLPFWAKPPIEILRIYNYESLYSYNDWESIHTERLVFHNIKSILFNFSDTLNKIELLYPKNYYITVFPNTYFKNIIDFLRSENFKLKKIVIVIKGKKYIDENMMKSFKENLQNFKGMTTEVVKKEEDEKNSYLKGQTTKETRTTRTTKQIIEEMKRCVMIDNLNTNIKIKGNDVILNSEIDKEKKVSNKNQKDVSKNKNISKEDDISHNYNSFPKLEKPESFKQKQENIYVDEKQNRKIYEHKETDMSSMTGTKQEEKKEDSFEKINNSVNINFKSSKEKYNVLDDIDLSDKYNMDMALYQMYYNKKKEETDIFFNSEKKEETYETKENEKQKKKFDNSSESTCSEDESDDENIDGFFKSKKLKTTVYDKKDFSFSEIMNNIIHYEKIIDYLYNDDLHIHDSNSKVKFYVKMLYFEKTYTNINIQENSTAADQTAEDTVAENATETRGEENNSIRFNTSDENGNIINNNLLTETYPRENTEANTDMNVDNSGFRSIFNNVMSNESSSSISNLIQNFLHSLEQNNILFFNNVNNAEETQEESSQEQNHFNFDNIQDSLTRITFNFN